VTALLLLGVSVVVFAILYLAPGDRSTSCSRASRRALSSPSACARRSACRTWYGQYAAWFGKMLQGNFGNSIRTRPAGASGAGARRRPTRSTLTLGSLVLTLLIAVPIAVHAAAHGDTAGNTAATIGAYIVSAVPVFWLGYIVVYVFIHQFGMFR